MDKTVAEEYKSSLNDLNFNSKPLINMLTMLADENKKHAPIIVNTIVNHINSVPPDIKLPCLYLVDSIMKNLGEEYRKILCQRIVNLFTSVFEKVDENIRSLMFKLRQTWNDILPYKTLLNLDCTVKQLDPAWPITAKKAFQRAPVKLVEEKKTSDGPPESPTSLKNEEDQIKQKQGEVLKQLLAKQEQLRQLEFQKTQLSIKKKNTVGGHNILTPSLFKKNSRDPRMARINVSQNVLPTKSFSSDDAPAKPFPSKLEEYFNNLIIPSIKNVAPAPKTPVQTSFISNKNVVEQCAKSADPQAVQQKKIPLKSKNKQAPVSNFKVEVVDLTESTTPVLLSTNKSDISSVKIHEKNSSDFPKVSKVSPKKKNLPKIPRIKAQVQKSMHAISQMKSSMMSAKEKIPLKVASLNSTDDKVAAKNKKEHMSSSSGDVNVEMKNKSIKIDNAIDNKPKLILTEDSQENRKNLNVIGGKDEDLRVKPISLNIDGSNIKIPKRDVQESKVFAEMDEQQPPKKKMRADDAENHSPDQRSNDTVLFGKEDQDLRHSIDWSDYKVNHPDECSPGIQENFDGRFKSRKYQSPIKYYHQSDYERYGNFRPSRGRYSRRNFNRKYFPRGTRGRWQSNPTLASVMSDSHAILKEAEKKFHSGRISEAEYVDLCQDLQKMVETSEYQLFKYYSPQKEDVDHVRIQENQISRQEPEQPKQHMPNVRIQKSSSKPPPTKTFFLDGKERIIHFINDKAIVIMDNNEPHELTFKNEEIKVYIDGMVEPLILNFDGKSVEFDLNGQRHVMRAGIPGRELYIDNHPYEAQFGGSPLAALLEDGRVYKMNLSGPAPQVIIGDQPMHELFAKHYYDIDHVSKDSHSETSHTEFDIPSFGSLHDVDMRVKPNVVPQHSILTDENSPFYFKDTKDVDWRQIPPVHSLKDQDASCSHATWINEDGLSSNSFKDRSIEVEKSVPMESDTGSWDTPVQHYHPPVHKQIERQQPPEQNLSQHRHHPLEQSRQHPSEYIQQQMLHFPPEESYSNRENIHQNKYAATEAPSNKANLQQHQPEPPFHKRDNTYWQSDNYRKRHDQYSGHVQESGVYQETKPFSYQHFENEDKYFEPQFLHTSRMPYAQRPPFRGRNNRGRFPGPRFRPGFNSDFGRPRQNAPLLQLPRLRVDTRQRPLLPPPPFLPPFLSTTVPPQVEDVTESQHEKPPGLLPTPVLPRSEIQPVQPSTSKMQVDIESLLEKLVAAGIINTKMGEEPEPEPEILAVEKPDNDEDKETEELSEEISQIELTPESLRKNHPGVLSALHQGLQCATCGIRFKESQNDQYSRHLDWHFRINRREKDTKRTISRPWYFEIEDWLQFEEFEDFEERIPSYFELQAEEAPVEIAVVPAVVSVVATSDDQDYCPVCHEKFQLFWVEDEEEWHYRNAVRRDKIAYHPACYEDFKKAADAEKALKEAEKEIMDVLTKIIDEVCELNPSNDIEDVKVPPVEDDPEEEILEGKPGEEEIIGLISESEMEVDTDDSPKDESKMVVMSSGGITLKVKAESLQCHSPPNLPEKDVKVEEDDEEIDFRPPTPDPNFSVQRTVNRGRELSGLCCIM